MPAQQEFDRVRENRARRAAERQGLKLAKIQRRDIRALGWNRWLLTDPDGKLLISYVVRGTETGASLEQVEEFLRGAAADLGAATDAVLRLAGARQTGEDEAGDKDE